MELKNINDPRRYAGYTVNGRCKSTKGKKKKKLNYRGLG
jgi:hypothetical protein